MKKLFFAAAILLILLGLGLRTTQPSARSVVPVLYWVIDPAPARPEQIHLFHLWLIENGHGTTRTLESPADLRAFREQPWSEALKNAIREATPDGAAALDPGTDPSALPLVVRYPNAEMRLDAASNDLNKKVIQGVSGIAGDVVEAGGVQMPYLASIGMLADLTESAREKGFGPDKTYPALKPALFYQDRQYAFPRNPAQNLYWVNRDTFKAHGQPPPPRRWTLDEFERRGKAFVEAANPRGGRHTVFFADRALVQELRRGMGLSIFNETMTRSTLDDPRNAELLARVHKWTYEDRILPSAADRASFDTQGGWGGQTFQLFKSGRYGMVASGRWALMVFRQFEPIDLAVVEPPHAGLPNTLLAGGRSTVYVLSPHREYAELFLAFMADEAYNMQIVRDGDGLPPNPKYVETEAFTHPPDYPNEWGSHEVFSESAQTIAITRSSSPFVLTVVVERIEQEAMDMVMNGRATPEEAARNAAARVNAEIRRTLDEQPNLRRLHDEWSTLQRKIDAAREKGEPIDPNWVKNPFHQRLYQVEGRFSETADDAEAGL